MRGDLHWLQRAVVGAGMATMRLSMSSSPAQRALVRRSGAHKVIGLQCRRHSASAVRKKRIALASQGASAKHGVVALAAEQRALHTQGVVEDAVCLRGREGK